MPADQTDAAWQADIALPKQTQARLIDVITTLPAKQIDATTIWYIHGAEVHDLYHTGQIKLLRKILAD